MLGWAVLQGCVHVLANVYSDHASKGQHKQIEMCVWRADGEHRSVLQLGGCWQSLQANKPRVGSLPWRCTVCTVTVTVSFRKHPCTYCTEGPLRGPLNAFVCWPRLQLNIRCVQVGYTSVNILLHDTLIQSLVCGPG